MTKELLKLEQEYRAEDEAKEKKTAGEQKEEKLWRKFTRKSLTEAFADLNNLLK